jgi:Flp pilus assembly protein TadD
MKIILSLILFASLCSCTIPWIYVIEDPHTAAKHNELGKIYENQGKYELAEKEFKRAAKKQKEWAVPHFNLGNVYFKMGELGKAEDHFRQALERDENNPDFMNNLAYVLSEEGKFDEAEEWINKALSLSPKEEYLDTLRRIQLKKSVPPPSS